MAKPQKKLVTSDDEEFGKLFRILSKALSENRELFNFFEEILTESEMRMITNRFKIARLLSTGHSVREIAAQVGVGTDTVVRVSKMAKNVTFQKIMKTLQKEKQTSIEKTVKKETKKQPSPYWVFGRSEEET